MNLKVLAAAVLMLAPLTAVNAQTKDKVDKTDKAMTKAPADQAVSFDALDANKDGRISMPEASADAKLVEAFSAADKNGDGYLDNAEYESIAKQPKH
jgi:Ca2+-binding EF-hand superfamily protein